MLIKFTIKSEIRLFCTYPTQGCYSFKKTYLWRKRPSEEKIVKKYNDYSLSKYSIPLYIKKLLYHIGKENKAQKLSTTFSTDIYKINFSNQNSSHLVLRVKIWKYLQ